jgi:hypothetical protein
MRALAIKQRIERRAERWRRRLERRDARDRAFTVIELRLARAIRRDNAVAVRKAFRDLPGSAERLGGWLFYHPGDSMETALGFAAAEGALACVVALLDLVDPDGQDTNDQTPLMRAARRGQLACLRALLPHADATLCAYPGTALMIAAREGAAECLRALLPASDAKARNEFGQTALMFAAEHGHLACVEILLPFSDLDAHDDRGRTALDCAAQTPAGRTGCLARLRAEKEARDVRRDLLAALDAAATAAPTLSGAAAARL